MASGSPTDDAGLSPQQRLQLGRRQMQELIGGLPHQPGVFPRSTTMRWILRSSRQPLVVAAAGLALTRFSPGLGRLLTANLPSTLTRMLLRKLRMT